MCLCVCFVRIIFSSRAENVIHARNPLHICATLLRITLVSSLYAFYSNVARMVIEGLDYYDYIVLQ